MGHQVPPDLERLRRSLRRGFVIDAVDSTDATLLIHLSRGSQDKQVRVGRDGARRLLNDGVDLREPVPM